MGSREYELWFVKKDSRIRFIYIAPPTKKKQSMFSIIPEQLR